MRLPILGIMGIMGNCGMDKSTCLVRGPRRTEYGFLVSIFPLMSFLISIVLYDKLF